MTLLYRGIWNDNRPDLIDSVTAQFQGWLTSQGIELRLPDEGREETKTDTCRFEVVVRRAITGSTAAVQVELSEEPTGGNDRCTTRLTAIEATGAAGAEQWVWVDRERVTGDTSQQRPIWEAPTLVRALIEAGHDCRIDQVRLTTEALPLPATGLVGLIRNTDRSLPLVVFSEDPIGGYTPTLRRANRTAGLLTGAAQVMILDRARVEAFREALGDELAVWDGAARVYLPNAGPDGLVPARHRSLSRQQMGDDLDRPARILAGMLAGIVTGRRAPAAYETVRRELRLGRDRSDAEYLAYAEQEIARLTSERDELKDQVSRLEEDLFDTQADLEEAIVAEAHVQNQIQLFLVRRDNPSVEPGTADLAVEAQSISEALALARAHLTGIVVPDGIERDLDELDAHTNTRSWGQLTWSGLRALHLYAEADFDGDFRKWCIDSGHQWAWPSSGKKLAMRESETVESSRRFSEQRRFPVSVDLDRSGSLVMVSHLKIAEGGGPLAPRVYFHDDTRGVTGKVHVGFVGPHHFTQNTKTN